jgi:hypothetical protein
METVVKCEKLKDWTGKDGKLVPIYSIGLSDGRGGESFGKEIPVGTPVSELILETGNYGLKIKWNKPGSGGGFGGSKRSGNESFALSYAKDLVVAGKVDIKQILPLADKLYDWLNSKKEVSTPVVLASQLPTPKAQDDDLPF